MRNVLRTVATVFISAQVAAGEVPACPDRGIDPDTFCPLGMVWSEEAQQCLGMV